MWGAISIARRNNGRITKQLARRVVAQWTCNQPIDIDGDYNTQRRFSSRKSGSLIDDIQQINLEQQQQSQTQPLSATDMEFYNQFADDGFDDDDDDDDDDDEGALFDKEYRRKQEEIQRELDSRTGRPWTDPWEISEEQWMSATSTSMDELTDWSPEYVSRISQDRVKVHSDGIPTLTELANLPLPPPACPHPGHGEAKAYAAHRKRMHFEYVSGKVEEMAESRVNEILSLPTWDEKQDAVDELFEKLEIELKEKEDILGKHPEFGHWVERSLQQYLAKFNKDTGNPTEEADVEAVAPLFMDLYSPDDGPDVMVPSIISPLKPHPHDGPGRMVEEWELAAHSKTKRILIRESAKNIAQILEENEASRIYVHGRKGIGKTAVLASVVASARRSSQIVMFVPDGDRLRKNGFFITPNAHRDGIFDLQNLSQEACSQFLTSHEKDLVNFIANADTMERYFKETQLARIPDYSGGSIGLVDLLKYSQEKKVHAPMCFNVVVETLMNQEDTPFLMVWDEFNCYYDRSQYYHMAYDETVREPIPYEKISLFQHAMEAMALSVEHYPESPQTPKLMRRGGIIVGVTESHAVPRRVTDGLLVNAVEQSLPVDDPTRMHVIEVPRFSDVEADCILSNFESIGVGKLRLDRGETVMNEQEVAYLKTISGNIGQHFLDGSLM